jgi:uncharacterized SAM-binding protein YcdF (DUF218 family)
MRYLKLVFPALLITTWGIAFIQRKNGRAARALCLTATLLLASTWPPVGWILNRALEWEYVDGIRPVSDAEAIVVLSGGGWAAQPRQPYEMLSESTVLRCRHGAWVYHNWKGAQIVVSGPRFSRAPQDRPVSEAMRGLLTGWGVPRERILLESEGTSTHEEAVQCARMLKGRGISRVVLVTEAFHMRRAAGSFRKQGMDVDEAPCGFRSTPVLRTVFQFLPGSGAIDSTEGAIRELAAGVYYKVMGKM